jgi:hypothetical protein
MVKKCVCTGVKAPAIAWETNRQSKEEIEYMKRFWLLPAVIIGGCLIGAFGTAASEGSDPFRLALTVRGAYSDNRDSTEVNEDNTDIYIGPEIGAYFEYERSLADLYYAPMYRYRTDPSAIQNEDEFHHDLSIRLEHWLTPRFLVRARERFNFTDDPSITEGGATLRRDASYAMNRVNVGVNYLMTEQTGLDLEGRHMIKRYDDDDVADQSDEDRTGLAGALNRHLDEYTSVGLIGSYDEYDSDNAESIERGFAVILGGLGFNKQFSPHLAMALKVGAQFVEYDEDDDQLDEETVPYGNISLTLAGTPDTRILLEGDYSVQNAYSYPFASMEHTHVFAKGEVKVSPKIKLSVTGEYRVEEYDEDGLTAKAFEELVDAGRPTRGEETTVLATASAAFWMDDKTSISLTQLYEDVDSDVFVSFTRNATQVAFSRRF